jgi:putative pyruvate formate lyase activating enzyme
MNPVEASAKYLQMKHIPSTWDNADDTATLWREHEAALHRKPTDGWADPSLLDLKTVLAQRIFHQCHFCERSCNVDRGTERGWCGVGQPAVASEFLHLGEEPALVPSHTVFFSGCTFSCVFCQNYDISQHQTGLCLDPAKLAAVIAERGGKNVNWVGGEPTPNLPFILKVLSVMDQNVLQVWNSNMYCSRDTMHLLEGVMDIYLTDFKYGANECALRFSGVHNYWAIVTRNHLLAQRQGQVIIRHLVMPGHIECCSMPILDWIARHMPAAQINIMDQYRPAYRAHAYPGIDRCLLPKEYRQVVDYARHHQLTLIH